MAEALAVVGSVGAICSLVAGIGKVILLITDISAKWQDADLTLLSMASQLTALRAATTKIQEWTEGGLQNAHHQLIMDLDISIKCCQLLISKAEGFFAELADLTDKPLDLRQKFKVVFGSAGPENVQKLIERQTSALTLLLIACNCNTLSEQQQHLTTTKSRKVLKRVQADSVSLCAQRDAASFASKMTDNLSKISRIFELDQNVFSSKVYERAFRGSVKQVLKKQQGRDMQKQRPHNDHVYLLGNDEVGKDSIINAVHLAPTTPYMDSWLIHRSHMQQLCVELMCIIIKRGTPDWDAEHISILLSYSLGVHDGRPDFSDALNACAVLWWSSLRRLHEPDPDPQGYLREVVEFKDMVFHVDIMLAGGLNIYCGNIAARFFLDQMEHILPLRTTEPRYAEPSAADYHRAQASSRSSYTVESRFDAGANSISLIRPSEKGTKSWPSFQDLQSALALALVFDMQDYGNGTIGPHSELQARLESSLLDLASLENRGTPDDMPFLLLLLNSDAFSKTVKKTGFSLTGAQHVTYDPGLAISEIELRFRQVVRLPLTSLVVELNADSTPTALLDTFGRIGSRRNGLEVLAESEE